MSNKKHFIGRTFFAHYETSKDTKHDRMMFIDYGLDHDGFFDWVQSGRNEIEKATGAKSCVVINCYII